MTGVPPDLGYGAPGPHGPDLHTSSRRWDEVYAGKPVVAPDDRYFMACFRGQQGHHRAPTHEEIAAVFADGWRVDSIDPATLEGAANPVGIPACLVALTRT